MDFAEAIASDVGINFGGADGRVAEQFLNHAQIRAIFQKVSGEAVTQHVRGDIALNAGAADTLFDAEPKGDGGKGRAAFGEENIGGRFLGNEFGPARIDVTLHGGDGFSA